MASSKSYMYFVHLVILQSRFNIRSFVRSFIHSFIHSFTHSLTHSLIHSFIHLSIHPSIHPSNHSFIIESYTKYKIDRNKNMKNRKKNNKTSRIQSNTHAREQINNIVHREYNVENVHKISSWQQQTQFWTLNHYITIFYAVIMLSKNCMCVRIIHTRYSLHCDVTHVRL